MPDDTAITGKLAQYDHPNWQPLINLVGEDLAEWFMWMHEIRLEDGSRVHAYKHVDTRRYLHLGEDGRAFGYAEPERYRPIAALRLTRLVFGMWVPPWERDDE